MGVSADYPLLLSLGLKGIRAKKKGVSQVGSLWESHGKRRSRQMKGNIGGYKRRSRRVLMKRRRRVVEGSRRRVNAIEERTRILKKLIPNSTKSMGLEGLFRETADYILSLQMRVQVMQIMVKVLGGN
ncbi:transcription factor UPBEAT1 [Carica papaya]|uniref:transcription factor UPBEAT1 n=1 Tax=Carica papaya TaxID=3649 RepID=UPI000B8D0BC2|nr:transcription factor UPBEAT1 [Carica papaya]